MGYVSLPECNRPFQLGDVSVPCWILPGCIGIIGSHLDPTDRMEVYSDFQAQDPTPGLSISERAPSTVVLDPFWGL